MSLLQAFYSIRYQLNAIVNRHSFLNTLLTFFTVTEIFIILIFSLFLAFIVFNLENKSDVSFYFITFPEIPVFLTSFVSFVLGMVFSVPFALSFGKKRKKSQDETPDAASWGGQTVDPRLQDSVDKKALKKKKGRGSPQADEIKRDTSSYGID